MALLTTTTDANKVRLRAPFTVALRTMVWVNGFGSAWHVETITREAFEYVGLDEDTALAAVTTLVATYTVSRNIPSIQDGEITYTATDVLTAEVVASPMGGRMWKVSVDRNDKVTTFTPLVPPA